ncbi:MAG: dihydrolipoyl dehydrogenase, partial [Gammaproteobacteria bacterium]|nr:dihydrolipoyl dehydrogenase [Gammaproteobacteria bacterium]
MTNIVEIRVPDIGNFKDVAVIDVMVKPGDTLENEQGLITLETDKAAMDVPSPYAGIVKQVQIKKGDKASEGTLILTMEVESTVSASKPQPVAIKPQQAAEKSTPPPQPNQSARMQSMDSITQYSGKVDVECEVLVLGSGPGGYTAAFRAADLGKQVVLVERYPSLGGVCLNVGCIPSKALLHAAKVIEEAESMSEHGISFGKPRIDTSKLRTWKNSVVGKLTGGLATLAKQRKVQVVQGIGKFIAPRHLAVEQGGKKLVFRFQQCIIAAGSQVAKISGFPDDPRILDSTSALELEELPERMLVIGGGIIGLEMACVYDALGVKITVVELTNTLIPEADRDLVRVLQKRIEKRYEKIHLGVKVAKLEATKQGIKATFDGPDSLAPETYGCVLISVGRRPNGKLIDADKAGI